MQPFGTKGASPSKISAMEPRPWSLTWSASGHRRRLCVEVRRRTAQPPREAGCRHEGVVPERVDLDRLAQARRHDPIADLRVHPRELHAGGAGGEQAVGGVLADAVAGTVAVP